MIANSIPARLVATRMRVVWPRARACPCHARVRLDLPCTCARMCHAQYKYHLTEWHMGDRPLVSDNLQFSASGRVNVTNKEDVAKFFEEVYNATGTSFNMKSGRPDRNKESFRGFRKCIMNVSHSEKSKKLQRPNLQRKCPVTITFCLEKPREVLERDSSERVAKKTIEGSFRSRSILI